MIAGDQASPEQIARIRASLGLDRPFLVRFGEWLWQVAHGDLGTSIFTNLPVSHLIAQRLEPTLSLMALTLLLSVLIAVPLGVLAASRAGRGIDRAIMVFAVFGFSTPVFVVGYLLAYVFALRLRLLPVQGFVPISQGIRPFLASLLLPAATLGTIYVALIARVMRAAMLDVLGEDFIRTARAKGLGGARVFFVHARKNAAPPSPVARAVRMKTSPSTASIAAPPILTVIGLGGARVFFVHALKNAAPPILTVIGIGVALLIGGAVVTESVFAIPGLGRLTVDSILRRDYPVIQGVVLLFSFAYVLVNLLVDLLYLVFDPRIRQ